METGVPVWRESGDTGEQEHKSMALEPLVLLEPFTTKKEESSGTTLKT